MLPNTGAEGLRVWKSRESVCRFSAGDKPLGGFSSTMELRFSRCAGGFLQRATFGPGTLS